MRYPEERRKLSVFFGGDSLKLATRSILEDYLYSGRACSFIYPSSMEENILYLYTSKKVSRRKLQKIVSSHPQALSSFVDMDNFFFFAKQLKDAYIFADGIFIDENRTLKQKKLYLRFKKYQEVLLSSCLNDLSFLDDVLRNKKIIYIDGFDSPSLPLHADIEKFNVNLDEAKDYESWFEWFDILKMRIMTQDFDVAFISLGVYSSPIGHFIATTLHKIAISLGGKEHEEENN